MPDECLTEDVAIEIIRDSLGTVGSTGPVAAGQIVIGMDSLDDASVVLIDDGTMITIASDFIRGDQFDLFELGYLNHFDLGYYLVSANLSDIAAMGSTPIGITIICRYPNGFRRDDFRSIFDGIRASCVSHGCKVFGGDTGGARILVLSAAAVGLINGRPLLRKNARVGDLLYFVGHPGRARAATMVYCDPNYATGPFSGDAYCVLLEQWRRPKALLELGQRLALLDCSIACTDGSDGIRAALYHIAQCSGVDIHIDGEGIHIEPLLRPIAKYFNISPLDLFFGASVDFGLVFSLPPNIRPEPLLPAGSPPIYRLGTIVQGNGMVYVKDGPSLPLYDVPGYLYIQ